MSKTLTEQQIKDAANAYDIEYAALRAVIEVEARGNGFLPTGEPVILFERHWFWRLLGKQRWYTWRLRIRAKHPHICHPKWGAYGRYSAQHEKLQLAASYNREAALQSASYGLLQVMGFNYKTCGFDNVQDFVNAMWDSEYKQLLAGLEFIKNKGLVDELQRHDWAGFAYVYNGSGYKRNEYDKKLARAYAKYV